MENRFARRSRAIRRHPIGNVALNTYERQSAWNLEFIEKQMSLPQIHTLLYLSTGDSGSRGPD